VDRVNDPSSTGSLTVIDPAMLKDAESQILVFPGGGKAYDETVAGLGDKNSSLPLHGEFRDCV